MKRGKKLFLLFAGCLAACAVVALAVRSKGEQSSDVTFRPVTVERGDIRIAVLTTGTVQPENRLQIKPSVGGRIEEIYVKEGDAVKKGRTLALMSSTDRAALIDAARAHGPGELAYWEDIYKPAPIVAPMDGVIIARAVEPGQTISVNDAAFVMSDHLLVLAQVDETDLARVKLGQQAEITLDAYPNDLISAKVTHIAYEARTVNNVTMYDVQVTPHKVPAAMRSGMTANISFKVAEKQGVLLLPVAAVNTSNGHSTVIMHHAKMNSPKNGEPPQQPVEITTGLTDGKVVEVVAGLKENDTIAQMVINREKKDTAGNTPFFGPPKMKSNKGGGGPPPP